MSHDRNLPILGTHVREMVRQGATLTYVPFYSNKERIEWEVHLNFPDGGQQPVLVSKTAHPKILKTADAVISYHRDLFPNVEGLFVPYVSVGDEESAEDV